MSKNNLYTLDIESALDEEIIAAALKIIPDAKKAWLDGTEGDDAGVTYYDDGTLRYYTADVEACRDLVEVYQRTHGVDAYSIWCAETTAGDGYETRGAALESEGWR